MNELTKTHHQIKDQLATAINDLGGDSGLISIIMSWGDTLTSEEVRDMLIEFNTLPQRQLS